jgi:hypothetical protein
MMYIHATKYNGETDIIYIQTFFMNQVEGIWKITDYTLL